MLTEAVVDVLEVRVGPRGSGRKTITEVKVGGSLRGD